MPFAVKATKDNVDYIVGYGDALRFSLSYVKDVVEEYAGYGADCYVVTDGTPEKDNVTFTIFSDVDFFLMWKFVDEKPDKFSEIVYA
jgi:hypothetical protein